MQQDITQDLQSQVLNAISQKQSLKICGSNSKSFYQNAITVTSATEINICAHQGVINYQPSELVITVRAGTLLKNIEKLLADNRQMLPFEPPHFGENATIGGAIASGFSGPARPYNGSTRDAMLGCKIINGHGEVLHFGGEVVKNVAGYDVTRLMTGAMGTLGILLEVSIKLLPISEKQCSIQLSLDTEQAIVKMNELRRLDIPVSAMSHSENKLTIRLSGVSTAVDKWQKKIGGDILSEQKSFWNALKEQNSDFFKSSRPLWRLSVPPATQAKLLDNDNALIDWAGAHRWYYSEKSADSIQGFAKQLKGSATLFHNGSQPMNRTFPLANNMLHINKKIKHAFDPHNIFNCGIQYLEI